MNKYRVLVTGSRDWNNKNKVFAILDSILKQHPEGVAVIDGGCPTGADRYARMWVWYRAGTGLVSNETYNADWDLYGKSAGPKRNQLMVDKGADVCVAFPLGISRGTRDCMKKAEEAGIKIINHGEAKGLLSKS